MVEKGQKKPTAYETAILDLNSAVSAASFDPHVARSAFDRAERTGKKKSNEPNHLLTLMGRASTAAGRSLEAGEVAQSEYFSNAASRLSGRIEHLMATAPTPTPQDANQKDMSGIKGR